MESIEQWKLKGDWFDVCKCNIPCPCYFAQTPTGGECEGTMVWHIREGHYGDVVVDDLNVLALASFTGNPWADDFAGATAGMFVDERADERQREALQLIFGGEAGGWPAQFSELIVEMRGLEFVPIEFEIADDLEWWSARIPGHVEARAEALSGPTTSFNERVQVHNPPGSEVGPSAVATQGVAVADQAEGFDLQWERTGQSSKHMNFDWSGPDQP
ncbi:hypothetical protein BSZ35_00285 [Salinibacter sp. 10B]|uniref:DUF1326 domain-containing protein n=1 Tax=Salinibacter sp. 10B TaxID=1923971 RepID=UPI000CF49EA8|nr:DUF1326 domain-containing protein [Salinibacter sp. 10B]PQJ36827.1 hypothetical protein BSZ35_00285 [Salinibacter sp. 10B]